jgi:deoxyribodipyrimidine photo-lyase
MTQHPSRYVYWVRNDLRRTDNFTWEALLAHRTNHAPDAPLLALVTGPPGWDAQTPFGWSRLSDRRKNLWLQAARGFEAEWLSQPGASLEFYWGANPAELLPSNTGAGDAVFASRGFATEEIREERAVALAASARGFELNLLENHDVWEPALWNFSLQSLPLTFSGYRRKVEALPPPPLGNPTLPSYPQSAAPPLSDAHPLSGFPFSGDAQSALAHLRRFVWETDGLRCYKETRNGLLGVDYSGKISPWLATGALSVRTVWKEVNRYESERGANAGSEWFKMELLWRSYFLWAGRVDGARLFGPPCAWNNGIQRRVALWTNGETPNAFVNAGMIELRETGYMSNRIRQNAASYFIHQLGLPWPIGASYFEHHLLDYEAAVNWGNWNHLAGGPRNPGRRPPFDPTQQAAFYDPQGAYQQAWRKCT